MKPRVLLVNPPIYDFSAYDFWLKPYGMLWVAGFLRGRDVASSMDFASSLGIRVMLSEFSPLPGTPDGETCRRWVDLSEPLWHNKTAFTMRLLGRDEINGLKNRANALNLRLKTSNSEANSANRTAAVAAPP
jgi:hypothetical protein